MAIKEVVNQGALMAILREAAKNNIKLTPTNADTKSIIQNTCAAGVGGAGIGIILSLLKFVPGPIGWVALGAGLIGAGVGFTATKYFITITPREDGQFFVTIEG